MDNKYRMGAIPYVCNFPMFTIIISNPRCTRFVTSCKDGTCRVWETLTGRCISVCVARDSRHCRLFLTVMRRA